MLAVRRWSWQVAMPQVCLLITVAFTQSDVLSAHPAGLPWLKTTVKLKLKR